MAKIKVMKSFIDIHTNVNHPVGEVLEVTNARMKEIQSVDPALIQVIPDAVPAKGKGRKKVEE